MIVRVSVIRCDRDKFKTLEKMMLEAEAVLAPGIKKLKGCKYFFAGADGETNSLINVSAWDDLGSAKQLDSYQPMLDLGKKFIEAGAVFERPIMNYQEQWQFGNI